MKGACEKDTALSDLRRTQFKCPERTDLGHKCAPTRGTACRFFPFALFLSSMDCW